MYLHIGNGETVCNRQIIGLFDLDTASVSGVTRSFLAGKESAGDVRYAGDDLPRSFLLIRDGGGTAVRLSRISTAGLLARLRAPIGGADE